MKNINALKIMYVILAYVCLQLVWWGYSITKLNNEIYVQKNDIINQQTLPAQQYYQALTSTKEKLNKRTAMVVGEGSIFLLLLLLAFYRFKKMLNRELEINAQQKNFLMAVTHELKSPIASARLQLETLQKRTLSDVQKTQLLNNANADLVRLTNLVDNILHATSIDAAQYPMHKEWTNASVLVTTLVSNYELMYKNKIKFSTSITPEIQLYCDSQAIVSIVTNLIDNAIKFSVEVSQPHVHIALSTYDEHIQLAITDNGIGISDAKKLLVFDKFYRIGNEATRQTKGSGLGLFIVKHLVLLHNATIDIKDGQPQGTSFVINFN
jgi:signal transduction histidine kinase